MLLVLAASVGYAIGGGQSPSGVVRADTVFLGSADYDGRVRELVIERDGLRARLEGVTTREPEVVVLTDTVIRADTVLRFVTIDSRGRLSYELLARADSANVPLFRPELRERVDISDCDDRWGIAPDGSVTCDVPRAGHMWLAATLSRQPSLGVHWRKSYRSPWEVSASYDGARLDLAVRRSVQLW